MKTALSGDTTILIFWGDDNETSTKKCNVVTIARLIGQDRQKLIIFPSPLAQSACLSKQCYFHPYFHSVFRSLEEKSFLVLIILQSTSVSGYAPSVFEDMSHDCVLAFRWSKATCLLMLIAWILTQTPVLSLDPSPCLYYLITYLFFR